MKEFKNKIAILQPLIPHYRKVFFNSLSTDHHIDIFTYKKQKSIEKNNMKQADLAFKELSSFNLLGVLLYNFFPLMNPKYKIVVLPGEIRSLSTWLLLFIGKLTSKKIILWGHGISVKNYLQEEKELLPLRVFFHKLADHIWLYTKREKEIWRHYIDDTKLTALGNSIDTKQILNLPELNKEILKKKYNIKTEINLIFCARFTANRRVDLMLKVIDQLDKNKYGVIIIGEGEYKPDFSSYSNVYDFGAVYESNKKHELFSMSDLYFQPAWTGLSIVEAMAYGKPIITFKRSQEVFQCVEYNYIKKGINGFIGNSVTDIVNYINNVSPNVLRELQEKTRIYSKKNLGIENMVYSAKISLNRLNSENK